MPWELQNLRVMVALLTPLAEDADLDQPAMERLVQRVTTGGVDGIVVLGSTGECASLPARVRRLVRRVVARFAGHTPVISGVMGTSLEEIAAEVDRCAQDGMRAVLVAPPFYYLTSPDGVEAFYQRVADLSPLPVILYNIPALTKIALAPESVQRLFAHPHIAGVKDSSRDYDRLQSLARLGEAHPGHGVWTGADTQVLGAVVAGATGSITAGPNLVPAWSRELVRAAVRGDLAQARRLQSSLAALAACCRRGVSPAGWKAALAGLGIGTPHMAPPLPTLEGATAAALQRDVHELIARSPFVPVGESAPREQNAGRMS